MHTLILYFEILLPYSILLALFEIYLDLVHKIGPWGDKELVGFWGKKFRGKNAVLRYCIRKVCGTEWITPYHIAVFGPIMIGAVTAMFIPCFRQHSVIATFGSTRIVPIIFISAILIGNMGLEDFLWFVLQVLTAKVFGWGEPKALTYLFAGNFPWRAPEDWYEPFSWFGSKIKLPKAYRRSVISVTILLTLQWVIIKRYG